MGSMLLNYLEMHFAMPVSVLSPLPDVHCLEELNSDAGTMGGPADGEFKRCSIISLSKQEAT